MIRLYMNVALLILISSSVGVPSAFALDPDFYRQKRIKKELKRKRERGAKYLASERKKRALEKEEDIRRFSKIRRKMKKAQEKREKLFAKDLKDKEKFRSRKFEQALRSAKKKRKKPQMSWEEEILEYDIPIREVKNKK